MAKTEVNSNYGYSFITTLRATGYGMQQNGGRRLAR